MSADSERLQLRRLVLAAVWLIAAVLLGLWTPQIAGDREATLVVGEQRGDIRGGDVLCFVDDAGATRRVEVAGVEFETPKDRPDHVAVAVTGADERLIVVGAVLRKCEAEAAMT